MDGLPILIFLVWLITRISQKSQKAKPKFAATRKKDSTFQTVERLVEVVEKTQHKLPLEQEMPMNQPTLYEGKSAPESGSSEGAFRGSMQNASDEGECLCVPELEHERETVIADESVYRGEIGQETLVDCSAKGLMQGVVMSEILTRPVQRIRRR